MAVVGFPSAPKLHMRYDRGVFHAPSDWKIKALSVGVLARPICTYCHFILPVCMYQLMVQTGLGRPEWLY